MVQKQVTLNTWDKQPILLMAVQGESQARDIIATLIDASGVPVNLTGRTARMYAEKPDKTQLFFDGVTQNAANGVVKFTLPLQLSTFAGTVNCQIIVSDVSGAMLVDYGLQIIVAASRFNEVVMSTSEFTALQEALATVQDIDNRVPKTTTIAGVDLQDNITLSELAVAGVITNDNLLHNYWFPNPVNQRGVSGAISTPGYFIDRWRLVSGTVTLSANGLILNGVIVQILEFAVGTDVTASTVMHSGTSTATYNNSTKTFAITSSGGTVRMAKLEKGTIGTGHNDPPQDNGLQLTLCQRYLKPLSGQYPCVSNANGMALDVLVQLPSTTRIKPTFQFVSLSSVYIGGQSIDINNFTFQQVLTSPDNTAFSLRFVCTQAIPVMVTGGVGGLVGYLDANL